MSEIKYGLDGKVALITGGSRGIGLGVAQAMAAEGANVVICGRKQQTLDEAAQAIDGQPLALACHIAKEDQVEAMFAAVVEKFGRLDILVNNVGMNLMSPQLADLDYGLWSKIIQSNLDGAFLCSRKAAAIMRGQNSGKIVSISSVAGRIATPAMTVYGVAKAAVEMLTKVLAAELAPHNVQVNAVAPAMVKTGFSAPFWGNDELRCKIEATIPLGRIAEVEDIVHPVLFLASQGARFITGQTIVVDGGATITQPL
ncbi:short-chain dehydrogenase/reductase SDR [Desulfarculus baarsii DSM 2075]|uniref:Short-chain dehydrogenase/reductase SDR n=1 Tax=Desulfarculus baarsii (strain ATCC 33931 / DSM 2075 / LMG 7858 / VKM B-1802 / 2st14) TaxID=644282 RepID=E1QDI0_DESB2|nr:SDR family oxidoreductase [Desulfarculus baarsii]ADK83499.1 short-chain dehydrogenase/reductase SDR [Desulfarculus baarsii DSM 2075]